MTNEDQRPWNGLQPAWTGSTGQQNSSLSTLLLRYQHSPWHKNLYPEKKRALTNSLKAECILCSWPLESFWHLPPRSHLMCNAFTLINQNNFAQLVREMVLFLFISLFNLVSFCATLPTLYHCLQTWLDVLATSPEPGDPAGKRVSLSNF